MLVLIKGSLTDIRRQGEHIYSYLYDGTSEPTLYRIKGEVEGVIGEDVTVQCRANVYKDRIYLTLETKK